MLSRPTYSRRSHDHRRRPRRPRCRRHGRLRGRGSRRGNRVVVVTVAAIV